MVWVVWFCGSTLRANRRGVETTLFVEYNWIRSKRVCAQDNFQVEILCQKSGFIPIWHNVRVIVVFCYTFRYNTENSLIHSLCTCLTVVRFSYTVLNNPVVHIWEFTLHHTSVNGEMDKSPKSGATRQLRGPPWISVCRRWCRCT